MAAKKRLQSRRILFVKIERPQKEALRTLAFLEHRSVADVVREALDLYLKNRDAYETSRDVNE